MAKNNTRTARVAGAKACEGAESPDERDARADASGYSGDMLAAWHDGWWAVVELRCF